MFMYIIDDNNNIPTPPPKATKVLGDTRLKPNEIRILNYKIPSKNIVIVVARAYYNLLLLSMKEKFFFKTTYKFIKI